MNALKIAVALLALGASAYYMAHAVWPDMPLGLRKIIRWRRRRKMLREWRPEGLDE